MAACTPAEESARLDRAGLAAATEASIEPSGGSTTEIAESPRLVPISRPGPAQTVILAPAEDEIYEIAPEARDAEVSFEAKDLVLSFPDDGRIVFRRMLLLAEAGRAPLLRVGETDIDGDDILGQAMLRSAGYPPLITGEVPETLIGQGPNPTGDLQSGIETAAGPEDSTEPQDLARALAPPAMADRLVFYATDRRQEGSAAADYRFSAQGAPEGRLSFGQLVVSAPTAPPGARGESPGAWTGLTLAEPPDAAAVLRVDPMWRSTFQDRLAARPAGEVLVFAHGPGLSFERAAGQIVALARALGFEGALVLYSWPAEGGDSENALIGRNLETVLRTVRAQAGGAAVHLLAHPDLAAAIGPRLGPPAPTGGTEPGDPASTPPAALHWRFGA